MDSQMKRDTAQVRTGPRHRSLSLRSWGAPLPVVGALANHSDCGFAVLEASPQPGAHEDLPHFLSLGKFQRIQKFSVKIRG